MADDLPLLHVTTRQELHDWLAEHHATSRGVWLVSWRRDHGPRLAYEDAVLECLCFGWIDSTLRTLDERRNAIRLTPRKPGSVWAASNKARVESLLAERLIQPAGLAVIERAKADGSWTRYDDVEAMVIPEDLAHALEAAGVTQAFAEMAPSRIKQALFWIKNAKREATRDARIGKIVVAAQEGRSLF